MSEPDAPVAAAPRRLTPGVTGWLLVLILERGFGSLQTMAASVAVFQRPGRPLETLVIGIAAALAGLEVLAIALLLRKDSRAPQIAIAWIAGTLLLSSLTFLAQLWLGDVEAPVSLGSMVVCALWLGYLVRSERVKLTYARPISSPVDLQAFD